MNSYGKSLHRQENCISTPQRWSDLAFISDSVPSLLSIHDNPFAYQSGAFFVILNQTFSLFICSLRKIIPLSSNRCMY